MLPLTTGEGGRVPPLRPWLHKGVSRVSRSRTATSYAGSLLSQGSAGPKPPKPSGKWGGHVSKALVGIRLRGSGGSVRFWGRDSSATRCV